MGSAALDSFILSKGVSLGKHPPAQLTRPLEFSGVTHANTCVSEQVFNTHGTYQDCLSFEMIDLSAGRTATNDIQEAQVRSQRTDRSCGILLSASQLAASSLLLSMQAVDTAIVPCRHKRRGLVLRT